MCLNYMIISLGSKASGFPDLEYESVLKYCHSTCMLLEHATRYIPNFSCINLPDVVVGSAANNATAAQKAVADLWGIDMIKLALEASSKLLKAQILKSKQPCCLVILN